MFSNPIIGGDNTLIRTSIHSPDYVPDVSGWTINKDGSAEFNNVTVRGTFTVTGSDGSYIKLDVLAGTVPIISLYPGNSGDAGIDYSRGNLYSTKNDGASHANSVILEGTMVELGGTAKAVLSGADTAGNPPEFYVGPASYSGDIDIILDGNTEVKNNLTVLENVTITGDLDVGGTSTTTIDGVNYIAKSAGGQNFTNTTVLANVTGMSFSAVANAVYEIRCRFAIGGPTAADVRLAWTVPAGAVMSRNILSAAVGITDNENATVNILRRGAATQEIGGTSGGNGNDFTGWWEDTILEMSGTSGTVQLQGAQGTANATPTVFQGGSYMIVTRIA